MTWINAMERLPEHGQEVWYYGEHLGVWRGRYEYHEDSLASPHLFICGESPGMCDRMDAPWWMPLNGNEGSRPSEPTHRIEQSEAFSRRLSRSGGNGETSKDEEDQTNGETS